MAKTKKQPRKQRKASKRVGTRGRKRRGKGKAHAGSRARRIPRPQTDPRLVQVMKAYDEAMRHFNQQHFRRAKDTFQKVLAGPSRELAERARIHMRVCEQRLQQPAPVRLRTPEDHYNYAVTLINRGEFEEAREHLARALKQSPKSDYIHYALATVAAQTGESEQAIKHLSQAIKLRPENRYQARNDADFRLMEDDSRFQELLYPERSGGVRAGA